MDGDLSLLYNSGLCSGALQRVTRSHSLVSDD